MWYNQSMIHYIQQSDFVTTLLFLVAGFLALVFALSLHEASHAFVAYKCGDNTPKAYGRLTLNPFKHFDWVGTLMLVLLGFGWAKPVPINPANFKNGRRGWFMVSFAGIFTNILCALLFMPFLIMCIKWLDLTNVYALLLYYFLNLFVIYNINFAVFNLLPIFPLDGFNMIRACCKNQTNRFLMFNMQYGQIVLIVFLILFSSLIPTATGYIFSGIFNLWNLIFKVV